MGHSEPSGGTRETAFLYDGDEGEEFRQVIPVHLCMICITASNVKWLLGMKRYIYLPIQAVFWRDADDSPGRRNDGPEI